ncbi:neural cell adhesion molecule L1.1 isoform X2 [Kryptolebias marmoratus]|uniref:neural cell adhesion molecule L1.1 isoform X2 n=1 Tax=Kryptolebias marmoratus TaxID=37003 RepID=UPI0007F8F059|nr:neural cell adhesion molecule L1.1 isoform X2 [Kryptolebias marmoratus]
MCTSQHLWIGCRGPYSPSLPLTLLLLPLFLLFTMPQLAQGAITIPKQYMFQNIKKPPTLTNVPTSFTAFFHEDINLTCEATGNPTPSFRWEKDGKNFELNTTGSGTIKAIKEEPLESYAGHYRCYASNTLGTAVTQTVKVIVEPQPSVNQQSKLDMKVYEGQSIILTCNPPESSIPPTIYWMHVGMKHINQSDRVMTGLDGNLYFANVLETDGKAQYLCTAQYTKAMTVLLDTFVQLKVLQSNDVIHGKKPQLLSPTGSHTLVQTLRGQNVTLECIPKGLPTPKVEWQKINDHLSDLRAELKKHNRWLYFESITEDDDGEYRCRASNTHGHTTHTFTVTVQAAPYWLKVPQDLMYTPGETVRLDCLAKGNPEPIITWSINGQRLENVDDDPRRTVTSSALILRDVEVTDTAVYQCEATNKHGSILLNIKLLVVELPPEILSSDGVVYKVFENGDIQMHCESFGSPRPHIKWERDDKVSLIPDPRVSLLTNGTIELENVTHIDSGVYFCSVKQTNISITANLEVFNRTVILTGPKDVHVVRGSAALLHCLFYKDSRLHDYKVEWRRNGHKLLESSRDDKYTVFDNNTLEVANVQSDDTANYSCEVHTKPLGSVSATGSITAVASPDPPSSLSLSDIEDHSVTLSWIPGPSHNSPITEFIVEAQEEPQSVEPQTVKGKHKWQKKKVVPGDFNHLQLILQPFCIFRFRVIAVNAIGRSDPSEPTEYQKTEPAAPSENPTGVRSNSTDPGTLIVTWDKMENRLHNGPNFQYKVYWREAQEENRSWNYDFVKSPPFQINNTGTYTPFEIKVQAVNSVGEGLSPEPQIGHSGEDKPEEAPTGVSCVVTKSTVRVTWNEAQRVRGQLLGYKIYIRRLGPVSARVRRSLIKHHHKEERDRMGHQKLREDDRWVVEVHGTNTSKELTDLRLFSQYELWVTAFNKKGESPPSKLQTFNTPEGVPGPPGSLRFESPTNTSLTLYWTPPLEINGKLVGYMVQYQQEVKSHNRLLRMQEIKDPNKNDITLKDLDPSSYYIFKVMARTAAGDGPPITERGATMLEGAPPSNITIVSSNTSFNLSWVPGERERNHGFHIHYIRKSVGGQWEESEVVNSSQGFYSMTGLQTGTQYHLKIVYGNDTHWQHEISTKGPVPSEMLGGSVTQGWLIGLISAVILLILILLILCLVKRSRGGKYAVKDKENKEVGSEVWPMKDETYGDYSDGDEKRSDSQRSLCDDSKVGSDDSLAEYGDSVDIQFNEDGSFIGQYSGRGPVPHGHDGSSPASPDSVPPPPMAPSMSSILNRPS